MRKLARTCTRSVGVALLLFLLLAATLGTAGATIKQAASDPSGMWPQVFYKDSAGDLWSSWRDYSGNWTAQLLGGSVAGNLVTVTDPNSAFVDVFWRGTDNALWYDERNQDGAWSGPRSLGGSMLGDPCVTVVQSADDESWIQVFYRGAGNALWAIWRNQDGTWNTHRRMNPTLYGNPVAATIPGSTTTQLFFRGADSDLWTIWRNRSGAWSAPAKLAGHLASDPDVSVVQSSAGPQSWLQVFYETSNHALSTVWRRADGSWANPQVIRYGDFGTPLAATLPSSTTTEVFYLGSGGALRSVWRNYDGSWAGPDRLAGFVLGAPAALGVQSDTSQQPWLQVFFRRTDDDLWSVWRNYDGSWSEPQMITTSVAGSPAAISVSS